MITDVIIISRRF